MPLYEYECPKCGRFEVIRKFSDKPLKKCPTCGKPIQKLASAPAIQFKGAGWYVTDYAKKSSGGESSSKSEGKESSSSTKTESTKSEASAPATPESSGSKTGKSKDKAAGSGGGKATKS